MYPRQLASRVLHRVSFWLSDLLRLQIQDTMTVNMITDWVKKTISDRGTLVPPNDHGPDLDDLTSNASKLTGDPASDSAKLTGDPASKSGDVDRVLSIVVNEETNFCDFYL